MMKVDGAAEKAAKKPGVSYPQMTLDEVLKPNNLFHDAIFGVSATYPEGWKVRDAKRWDANNQQNTVFFEAPNSQAIPSMYYQMYPEGPPASANVEAYLREVAQKKEDSRSGNGKNDYKNDPNSSFSARSTATRASATSRPSRTTIR